MNESKIPQHDWYADGAPDVFGKRKKVKARMTRRDWYMAFTLSIVASTLFAEGRPYAGVTVLGLSVLIVLLVDGFGVKLG